MAKGKDRSATLIYKRVFEMATNAGLHSWSWNGDSRGRGSSTEKCFCTGRTPTETHRSGDTRAPVKIHVATHGQVPDDHNSDSAFYLYSRGHPHRPYRASFLDARCHASNLAIWNFCLHNSNPAISPNRSRSAFKNGNLYRSRALLFSRSLDYEQRQHTRKS